MGQARGKHALCHVLARQEDHVPLLSFGDGAGTPLRPLDRGLVLEVAIDPGALAVGQFEAAYVASARV